MFTLSNGVWTFKIVRVLKTIYTNTKSLRQNPQKQNWFQFFVHTVLSFFNFKLFNSKEFI